MAFGGAAKSNRTKPVRGVFRPAWFLLILFWCLTSAIVAIFTYGNWTWVTINLWDDLVAEVNLPFFVLGTFLAGFVPTWLYNRILCWRLCRRLAQLEHVIAELRPVVGMGVPLGPDLGSAGPPPMLTAPPRQPPLDPRP